jgi:hypothetical protein
MTRSRGLETRRDDEGEAPVPCPQGISARVPPGRTIETTNRLKILMAAASLKAAPGLTLGEAVQAIRALQASG